MSPDADVKRTTLPLDANELLVLGNALNEVCNGVHIDDFEFGARIGTDREKARALLRRVSALYDELAQGGGG